MIQYKNSTLKIIIRSNITIKITAMRRNLKQKKIYEDYGDKEEAVNRQTGAKISQNKLMN